MSSDIEVRTLDYGRNLFRRIDRSGPWPLVSKSWWDDRLMAMTTYHEALKVQLFRFVDTLPTLINDPPALADHLKQYIHAGDKSLPWWARLGVRTLPSYGVPGRMLAYTARTNAERMARKFIAGSTVVEAVQSVRKMRGQGLAFTIDLLGEATITEAEADGVQQQYLDLINGLCDEINASPELPDIDRDDRGPIPRVNVSIKLSALFSQFDPIDPEGSAKAVLHRLRPILRLAREKGAFVNFDMEQYSTKDLTIGIFQQVLSEEEFRDWPNAGIAIQAYLKDSEADLHRLLDWARNERQCEVTIRLVKGAYWDYETVMARQQGWPIPVFTRKPQSDANFEKLSRLLLENYQWLVPAFGSHNVRSLSHALAYADSLKVAPQRYEFQVLYGMADPIKQAMLGVNRRVRVYTPYGQLLPGMAYLVRRLLENTSNDSFLRASFSERASIEELLMNPVERLSKSNGTAAVMTPANPSAAAPQTHFQNEPLSDFAKAEVRERMGQALKAIQPELGRSHPLVINNADVTTAEEIVSHDPSHSDRVIGRCGRATPDQARQAVAAAKAAFDNWRDTDVEERARLLRRVADLMRQKKFELSAWIVTEVAKPWREADADVAEAIDFCEFYADEAIRISQPRERNVPGEDNVTFYEPRGVSVVIAPWNFPLAILTGMTAAAVATGNTVIMKPAEQSSVVGAKLMELFREAELPAGVVNYLPGVGEEVGPVLVSHPDVALVAFTGSLPVALGINKQAAEVIDGQDHVKKVIAEMGGKNAIIVDSDADLDEAIKGVVDSAFGYAGQKCSACSRVIVLESIYDSFVSRLVEATRSLAVLPADDPGCAVSPVIDPDAVKRILDYIEIGKAEARLAYQHDVSAIAGQGYFVPPTVFADVPETAKIAQEEIFGPILAVMKANDLDDALRIANGTRYALTGGVFSRSPVNIDKVRKKFRVGNLYVNRKCTGALVDRQPFGGFKMSGIGSKAGGSDYLLQFVVPRSITENTLRRGFAPDLGMEE